MIFSPSTCDVSFDKGGKLWTASYNSRALPTVIIARLRKVAAAPQPLKVALWMESRDAESSSLTNWQ